MYVYFQTRLLGEQGGQLPGSYYLLFRIKCYDHSNENKAEAITGICFSSALKQMCLNKRSAVGIP